MISQLLFGEICVITETDKSGFVKITVEADGYTGWCLLSQLAMHENVNVNCMLTADWANNIDCDGNALMIPFGSSVPVVKEEKITLGNSSYKFPCKTFNPAATQISAEAITLIATKFLNTPYLWGGRSVFGVDCSGFTQMVYKCINIALLRDAHQQATQGEVVDFLAQAVCGDLAFFDDEDGKIIHVGLLLNSHEIIHASGKVQIDKIDNGGIINAVTGQRMQKLRIIKRYF